MRKLHKNHYLLELFTKSLTGKSWLEVGNDQTEFSRQLGRALKTQDWKVASLSPREPHILHFKGSDLSQVPDKAYDYVLFNWSIGKFETQSILNEAKRIAREGIILQDFLAAGDRVPAGITTPNYQLYEEQQWKEILSSYGRVIVTQQLPEQAIELGMRIPMQVRLFVVQVDDVRDTLPAAPDPDDFALHFASNMPPNSSKIAFSSSVMAPLLKLGTKVHQDMADLLNVTRPGEAVATFRPPAEEAPFSHSHEDLLDAAASRNFRDITPEELNAEYERIKDKPLEELTVFERGVGRMHRQGQTAETQLPPIRLGPVSLHPSQWPEYFEKMDSGQTEAAEQMRFTDETIVDGDYQGLETDAFLDSSSSPSKEE